MVSRDGTARRGVLVVAACGPADLNSERSV